MRPSRHLAALGDAKLRKCGIAQHTFHSLQSLAAVTDRSTRSRVARRLHVGVRQRGPVPVHEAMHLPCRARPAVARRVRAEPRVARV
eukprot:5018299-Prymnesium_polylepis.1